MSAGDPGWTGPTNGLIHAWDLDDSHVSGTTITDTIKVPTITLDDFTEQNKIPSIDFLKIDVEGFELEVLKGAAGLLSSKRIKMILFEANTPVLASIGRQLAPIYELMRSHSYAITDLDGEALTVSQFTGITFGDVLAFPAA